MIFLDTNILYHILHNTPKTDQVLTLLEENPGDYVIDMVVHRDYQLGILIVKNLSRLGVITSL